MNYLSPSHEHKPFSRVRVASSVRWLKSEIKCTDPVISSFHNPISCRPSLYPQCLTASKKNSPSMAVDLFCALLSDAAAKLSTLKLAPMSGRGRARQRRGKLSRHYSNSVFVSLSSLSLSLPPAHSHSLALKRNCPLLTEFRARRQFCRGRPDGSKIEEENSAPRQRRLERRHERRNACPSRHLHLAHPLNWTNGTVFYIICHSRGHSSFTFPRSDPRSNPRIQPKQKQTFDMKGREIQTPHSATNIKFRTED